MKKLIAFDLDGTLAPSKSHFDDRMVTLFNRLLETHQVCVISGGKYDLFQQQFLTQITTDPELLAKLHLMPTCGTRYYHFEGGEWVKKYAEDIDAADKERISKALKEGFAESGLHVDKTYGEIIEDRESQMSLSIMGQDVVAVLGAEGVRIKEEWDPDNSKKKLLSELIAPKIPDYEVRGGGLTTIDVTRPGIDKGYGMKKLMEATGLSKKDILFIGDRIYPGGNDYAVKELGIDCISVGTWQDTAYVIEGIVEAS